jgi:hypothetical protein
MNNQGLLSVKYLLFDDFMLVPDDLLDILADTESSICGCGSNILRSSLLNESVVESSDMDILIRCRLIEETTDCDYISPADKLGLFLRKSNYYLQQEIVIDSSINYTQTLPENTPLCGYYVHEIHTYNNCEVSSNNCPKVVQLIILRDTLKSWHSSIQFALSIPATNNLLSYEAKFVFISICGITVKLKV